MVETSDAASRGQRAAARDLIPVKIQGSMGPPDSFSLACTHTTAALFDHHYLFAFSSQVRSVAQQSRADCNKRHFSMSALMCSLQPRTWRTNLPA